MVTEMFKKMYCSEGSLIGVTSEDLTLVITDWCKKGLSVAAIDRAIDKLNCTNLMLEQIKVIDLRKELGSINKKMVKLSDKNQQLVDQVTALHRRIDDDGKQHVHLRYGKEISSLKNENTDLKQRNITLTTALSDTTIAKSSMCSEVNALMAENIDLKNQNKSLAKSEHEARVAQSVMSTKSGELKTSNQALKDEMTTLKLDIAGLVKI